MPDVIALAEVTERAATDLCESIPGGFEAFSLDLHPEPALNVAFLYRGEHFEEQPPLAVPDMPRGTRPMGVLDYRDDAVRIRFIACHWAPRFNKSSKESRTKTAHYLSGAVYDYLKQPNSGERRHVVVLGDLNAEPFHEEMGYLYAGRSRMRARGKPHHSDRDQRRVRLYNLGWRILGEQHPHDGIDGGRTDCAGTYYWRREKSWHTFDQIIVDGLLVSHECPFVDESRFRVVAHPDLVDHQGVPSRFDWRKTEFSAGASDHLPIKGSIVLSR